ncbi:unnamed protein product [marine sediment metagenome]|uniref:Uncharacterized protein n=1 Tax=marine sediment metagenome TaxID=412755 RepID=X0S2B2_9ZZZZ
MAEVKEIVQEIRKNENQIADGPIVGRSTSGDYLFTYCKPWPRNLEDPKGAQRAYFENQELGEKLLSTSQFYKLALSSSTLKPYVIKKRKSKECIVISKSTKFTITFKKGRITAISVKGAASK